MKKVKPIILTKAQVTLLRRVCAYKVNPITMKPNLKTLSLDIYDMFNAGVSKATMMVLIRQNVVTYSYKNAEFMPTRLGTKLADLGNGNPAMIIAINSSLDRTDEFINKNNRKQLR